MPELPEVDLMASHLRAEGADSGDIGPVNVKRKSGDRYDGAYGISGATGPGRKLLGITRRGKYLIFRTSCGTGIAHNAMSGYWDTKENPWTFDYVEGRRESSESDVRFTIDIKTGMGERVLRFHDARLFGSFKFHCNAEPEEWDVLQKLGPEPVLTPNTDPCAGGEVWSPATRSRFRKKDHIKQALMDQSAVVGFGNIYAAETLHLAKINPFRLVGSLSDVEFERVVEAGTKTLAAAITRAVDYSSLRCYRRKRCPDCQGEITKADMKGRSTYYCGRCQR